MEDTKPDPSTLLQQTTAEFVGTFLLVFAGCGAIMVNDITGGAITHVGVALTFGLIVMTMIYAFGHVSGAQFNPAVSLGFWVAGSQDGRKTLALMATQIAAAVLAAAVLRASLGNVAGLGATVPSSLISITALAVLEVALTFLLMIVILGTGLDRRAPAGFAGAAIGMRSACAPCAWVRSPGRV